MKLKTSKTDVNYIGVIIVIWETHQQNCLLTIFCRLFFRDPSPADEPFFSQTKGAFSRKYLIDKLISCFVKCKIDAKNYSCYYFRPSEVQ